MVSEQEAKVSMEYEQLIRMAKAAENAEDTFGRYQRGAETNLCLHSDTQNWALYEEPWMTNAALPVIRFSWS